MESIYLNWARGNRLSKYGGISEFTEDMKYSNDYIALYMPLGECYIPSKESIVTEVKSGTRAILLPKVPVSPANRYRIAVVANPELYEYAQVHYEALIEPGGKLRLYAKFHKDMNVHELDYLARLYLIG